MDIVIDHVGKWQYYKFMVSTGFQKKIQAFFKDFFKDIFAVFKDTFRVVPGVSQ